MRRNSAQKHNDSHLRELFAGEAQDGSHPWTEPASFALHMALSKLWNSWGVQPDVLLGIGIGHYAAACAAGVMTWEDGLQLVVERSRLEQNPQPETLDDFENFADKLDYFPADRPLICNLTGEIIPEHQLLAGRYWRRHATEPLQSGAGLATLAETKCDCVLELGSRPSLSEQVVDSGWPAASTPFLSALGHGKTETESILQTLGQLYVGGVTPDFVAFHKPAPREKIGLPTYPFDRRRYWITEVAKHSATAENAIKAGRNRD